MTDQYFRLVRQRFNGDCGIACLAMLLNRSYESVAEKFETQGFDYQHGIAEQYITGCMAFGFGLSEIGTSTGFIESVPGILTVPSLNSPGMLHYIVWTGKRVLDPLEGRENTKFYKGSKHRMGVTSQIFCLKIAPET